jgi:N-glycosylase/DNA lyase
MSLDLERVYDLQYKAMSVLVENDTNTDEAQIVCASMLASVLAQAGVWPALYNDHLTARDEKSTALKLVSLKDDDDES